MMDCTLVQVHLSTSLSTGSNLLPSIEPAFLMSFFFFFVLGCHAASPANSAVEKNTRHHRLVEHQQHLTANIEGSQSAEEEEPALSLFIQLISVGGPIELVVKVHT